MNTENQLPALALSIRQPWAWAVAFGVKTIENRSWMSTNPARRFRGAFAIHASTGMTRAEYDDARDFMMERGVMPPRPDELVRGAIIGTARISGVVTASTNNWFVGKIGLLVDDAVMLPEPLPCGGSLGFFEWRRGAHAEPLPPAAKWMSEWGRPKAVAAAGAVAQPSQERFL